MLLKTSHFDLKTTLHSGQVFHWFEEGDTFQGLIDDQWVQIRPHDKNLYEVADHQVPLLKHYFALDQSVKKMIETFPQEDSYLKAALKTFPGLRIMRQPLWECLATFITSSMKQVAHIRQMSLNIREKLGTPIEAGDRLLYAYPNPETMAEKGSEELLRSCGLGFRAKPLYQTACLLANQKLSLENLRQADDDTLLKELCTLPGVGPKIAQCVMLFAYDRPLAFPVDVWIERVLREWYFPDRKDQVSTKELVHFAYEYFGPYRGLAQQWLFHYARTSKQFEKKPPKVSTKKNR